MGLIQAFVGSLQGTLANQWLDFHTVPRGVAPTAAFFASEPQGQNAGRGSNTKGSRNIITNGSKIVVPEGYGLVLIENGKITALAVEAGGYEWRSDDVQSASIFAGDGFLAPIIKQSWEQFKFGGQPGAQQLAFFVSLKELPNNRFGTQSEIYFDDSYFNAQVGVITRGSYTLRITDPARFVSNVVPATYLAADAPAFDFTDFSNPVSDQLFNEVVGSLAQAFSLYSNDPSKGRITRIQSDSVGFAKSLAAAVEENYSWQADRGLLIEKVALVAIEYDAQTRELLKKVQRADALSGGRGNSNMQASVAEGLENAGSGDGGAGGMFGIGLAGQTLGLGGLQQEAPQAPAQAAPAEEDPYEKLGKLKGLLDNGVITAEDFEAAKKKLLGI